MFRCSLVACVVLTRAPTAVSAHCSFLLGARLPYLGEVSGFWSIGEKWTMMRLLAGAMADSSAGHVIKPWHQNLSRTAVGPTMVSGILNVSALARAKGKYTKFRVASTFLSGFAGKHIGC